MAGINMDYRELMIEDWVRNIETDEVFQWSLADYIDTNAEYCEPIPLTEEILKANGFRESSIECGCYYFPEKYQELNDRGFAVETDGEGRFWITDHQLMKTRYVHELQRILRSCELWELAENFKVVIWNKKE